MGGHLPASIIESNDGALAFLPAAFLATMMEYWYNFWPEFGMDVLQELTQISLYNENKTARMRALISFFVGGVS